jgi:type I restriction enzyme, R subunit
VTFTEPNTAEAHLRNLLAGAASVRLAQLSIGLASGGIHSARRGRM